jgi:hypothetical protein
MRPLPSLVAFVVFFALPVLAQIAKNQNPEGRLTGTVLDQRGEPLTNIYVLAFREETRMYMPTAVTDKAVRFAVEELEAGTYDMFGESDAADYPDTSLSLYGKEEPTRIVLGYGERAN